MIVWKTLYLTDKMAALCSYWINVPASPEVRQFYEGDNYLRLLETTLWNCGIEFGPVACAIFLCFPEASFFEYGS